MLTITQPSRLFGRSLLALTAVVLIAAGLYALAVSMAPQILSNPAKAGQDIANKLEDTPASELGNRLYIPKIGVDVGYQSGDTSALESGAWWRATESGSPADGGNFVLAAHRFQKGWTPQATTQQSPFYHIDKLAVGDQIVVDYEGQRYAYEVTKIYQVAPEATEIEGPTDEPQLTLYSCTLGGNSDGREVVKAKLQTTTDSL